MLRRRLVLACVLLAMPAACRKVREPSKVTARAVPTSTTRWKAVLMTGDDSIVAFDNARKHLKDVLVKRGIAAKDIRELSMKRQEQTGGVKASSAVNLDSALGSLKIKNGDGCLVYFTSHGAPWGFYMRDQSSLTPSALDKLLDRHCGKRPTVVFVSACYSGVFAGNALKQPNRAIFTAARDDRNSFGCGVEDVYTYWDACTIDQIPAASSWADLRKRLESCIRKKEQGTGLRFSYPQAAIGPAVAKLPVLGRRKTP